jgi:anthranilate phosphoribosyltransferase
MLKHYTTRFCQGHAVGPADAEGLFDALINERDENVLVELLDRWNAKGVTGDEIFEFATIMRRRMRRIEAIHPKYVDLAGTGGSRYKTFNVSTAAAFVVAGAGVPVAKHGNGAATSSAGSADVMSLLGINVDADPAVSERLLNDLGICFMFARRFHSLSPALTQARRSLGRPTIFNNLGPLSNPASAPHQLIGVWDRALLEPTAKVLSRLGTSMSWIVHAENGLDEISLTGKTYVAEVTRETVREFEVDAGDFGIEAAGKIPSRCSAPESAALVREILGDHRSGDAAEKLVLLNAAAAIYITGSARDLSEAYVKAELSVRSGKAAGKMAALAEATNR